MTPFIFEDGDTYYFEIRDRESKNYHNLYLYKDIEIEKKTWLGFGKPRIIKEKIRLYEEPVLVDFDLNINNIKREIKTELLRRNAKFAIKGWDGVVGDINPSVIKALKRDDTLNKLLS